MANGARVIKVGLKPAHRVTLHSLVCFFSKMTLVELYAVRDIKAALRVEGLKPEAMQDEGLEEISFKEEHLGWFLDRGANTPAFSGEMDGAVIPLFEKLQLALVSPDPVPTSTGKKTE